MKRILSILLLSCLISAAIFAADEGDEYDDGYIYSTNGAGDRFFKVNLGALFPVNFREKLYVGGCAELGYYHFLSGWFALGGELTATYNLSIGNKTLLMIPITFGVMIEPTIKKVEFPIHLNVGLGYETWQNMNYFPSFVAKGSAGVYYRFTDALSVGLNGAFMWVPQWYKDSSRNQNGLFANATIGVRYHF